MNITTKFNVDDEVYVMYGGNVSLDTKPKKVVKVLAEGFADDYVVIKYLLDDLQTFKESQLYATFKEAQDAQKDARLAYLRDTYGTYIDEYLELTQNTKKN
jgi:hypothetical protein